MNVRRDQILSWRAYEPLRTALRRDVMVQKARRRIHVGDALTFLFENVETMRDQIQEMVRLEQLTDEGDITHELDTYNAVLGHTGELAATLLVELTDAAERADKLARWTALPDHIYLLLDDGTRVRARYDEAQTSDERLSSVQYLKFTTGGRVPVAVGVDLTDLTVEQALSDDQRAALATDLHA